jgi:uncharacterized protein YjbI with pentapeptide repeats
VADEEAVKRLKRSVAEWNAWREENLIREEQSIRNRGVGFMIVSRGYLSNVNLSRSGAHLGTVNPSVNLNGADLKRAALIGADLRDADLRNADLRNADLVGANLLNADLRGANLFVANLNVANLYGTNLAGANLVRAYLANANVVAANLSGANLSDARLFETIFSNVDLSGVIGLETCINQSISNCTFFLTRRIRHDSHTA